MTIRSHHLIGVTVLLVAGLLLLFIGNVVWNGLGLKYSFVAEGNLQSVAAKLDLSPEFKLVGSKYYPGSCMDNCPMLTSIYTVNDKTINLDNYQQTVERKIASQGYKDVNGGHDLYVKNGQASYISLIYFTDSCSTSDYIKPFKSMLPAPNCRGGKDYQSVDLLEVDLTYN